MIYFYLMKDLPLLAILKIITTSCNFTQKKEKTPNQQTSKTNQSLLAWRNPNQVEAADEFAPPKVDKIHPKVLLKPAN